MSSDLDFEEFDVIEYLEDNDIYYAEEGKNVSEGWININCPFCGMDPSTHCGINLTSKLFHCWICGEKGAPPKLIQVLEESTWHEAYLTVEKYIKPPDRASYPPQMKSSPVDWNNDIPKLKKLNLMPSEAFSDNWPDLFLNYLRGRRFDPEEVIKKYQLRWCYLGKYKFRIIIPVIMNGVIINFTCRDVTDKNDSKYKTCPNKEAIIPLNKTLYNMDSVNEIMIIVEGPTDVWRIGDGVIAIYGSVFSNEQIWLIKSLAPKIVYIMLDSTAQNEAKKLGNQIVSIINKVEIIELNEGDPCELSDYEVKKFRKEIGLN